MIKFNILLFSLLIPIIKADNLCSIPKNLTSSQEICSFITGNCDDDFQIAKFHYCNNDSLIINSKTLVVLLLLLALSLLFITIGIITSNYLSPNLRYISYHCHLNEKIAGLTLLSLGNGSTDLFSTYEAMSHNSTSLAIGELIGSSLFLICFVIGVMGIVNPFKVNHRDFIRDLWFFSVLLLVSFIFIKDGKLTYMECIIMCMLYLVYLICLILLSDQIELEEFQIDYNKPIIVESHNSVIVMKSTNLDLDYLRNLQKFISQNDNEALINSIKRFNIQENQPLLECELEINDYSTFDQEELQYSFVNFIIDQIDKSNYGWFIFDLIKFPINFFLKIAIPAIFIKSNDVQFIQPSDDDQLNLLNYKIKENKLKKLTSMTYDLEINYKINLFTYFQVLILPFLFINIELSTLTKLILSLSGFTINLFLKLSTPQKFHLFIISIIGFILTLNFITIITSLVITILKNMGLFLNINESLLGLTVLSLGNSIGDLISNITLLKIGLHITGLNACFGAPLLYILLGIGINGLIIMFKTKNRVVEFNVSLNLAVSCTGIFCILVFYFIMIPKNNWIIGRKIGWFALSWWILINLINVVLELYKH